MYGVMPSFIRKVKQKCGYDVVIVVTESHLVESVFCGKLEDEFASVPRTEKTTCLAPVGCLIEGCVQNVERHSELCAVLLNVRPFGLVRYIVHDDMDGFYLNVWAINSGSFSQQTYKQQRILAAGECDQYPVALLQQMIVDASFVELLANAFFCLPVLFQSSSVTFLGW